MLERNGTSEAKWQLTRISWSTFQLPTFSSCRYSHATVIFYYYAPQRVSFDPSKTPDGRTHTQHHVYTVFSAWGAFLSPFPDVFIWLTPTHLSGFRPSNKSSKMPPLVSPKSQWPSPLIGSHCILQVYPETHIPPILNIYMTLLPASLTRLRSLIFPVRIDLAHVAFHVSSIPCI